MFERDAIVFRWVNDDRTRTYQLTAGGDLLVVERDSPWAMWGPPELAGREIGGVPELYDVFDEWAKERAVEKKRRREQGAPVDERCTNDQEADAFLATIRGGQS